MRHELLCRVGKAGFYVLVVAGLFLLELRSHANKFKNTKQPHAVNMMGPSNYESDADCFRSEGGPAAKRKFTGQFSYIS